jgi:CRISPR-associated protein Csb2
MSFAIVAEFPLGTYRGHRPDGSLDPLPSPARLHAALLAAAGQGLRALVADDLLLPDPVDRAALEWLEANPPDALACPPTRPNADVAVAFRAEGFFGMREKRPALVSNEDAYATVAIGGPVAWLWDQAPPEGVAAALTALCADVPYLGVTESPVILKVAAVPPTHRIDRQAGLLSGGGLDLEVAGRGRTRSLELAFTSGRAAPSVAKDRRAANEFAIVQPRESGGLRYARYVPVAPPRPAVPWPTVVALHVDHLLAPDRRLGWCVALHRVLVARIGDGAPALVTGHYEPGVPRPANRLAIQYLPQGVPGAPQLEASGAFLLLVPGDVDPADLAILDRAVVSLGEVRLGRARPIRIRRVEVLHGGSFWQPVRPGHVRTWVTATPAIPDSRPLRGRPWTIGDAALLSLGLVFRERFSRPTGPRSAALGVLADAVAGVGAAVVEAHKLNAGDVTRFVHRTNGESAIQPYRAALRLGDLASDGTILAIGQSRHLGGGLLTPVDLPVGTPATSMGVKE